MKTKPTIGQTLYSLNVGNAARSTPRKLTPVKVSKVGRKYFTVGEGWKETRFHLSNWQEVTNYSPNQKLYTSKQDWLDEEEHREIREFLRSTFGMWSTSEDYSLDQLRRIKAVLDE